MIKDSHNREINYMRLAVTDRCNLRCNYCMPEEGINFLKREDILSYEEMLRLIAVVRPLGIDKIRITGGEPFVRKNIIGFLRKVKHDFNLRKFTITSNATLLEPYLDEIPRLFDSMNISLDSLDKERFFEITRRDSFDTVFENIEALLERNFPVKINAVLMKDKNVEDILPFVEWTKNKNISVRFIEEMPFNGSGEEATELDWNYKRILEHITQHFKNIETLPNPKSSTSLNYKVKDFEGEFGIIPAFSRTFCGSCNRIRVTAKGELRTCLYSSTGTNLLAPMRAGVSDEELAFRVLNAVRFKEKDGFEAEKLRVLGYEAMTSIGG